VEQLEPRLAPASAWVAQGPGPILNGQSEGITSAQGNNPVSGAIEWVAPLVTTPNYTGNADVIYVATVNGGVWKTTNATAATPTWTPLTDSGQFNNGGLPAGMSLNSIAISPLNASTLFAGSGLVSSYSNDGGTQFGIARSTDGGATWTVTDGNVSGLNIRSIVPTQATVSGNEVVLAGTSGGVYRSTDGGASYTLNTTGIPSGSITDLVGDPGVATRFYAANNGSVYISNDSGATWALDNGTGFPGTAGTRVLLSVHHDATNDVVYGMVISSGGTLSNVYRSANQGTNWTALGVPSPPIFPGTQGGLHGAILADQTDPNSVWVSGDRQNNPFPNVNGANDFSGNVFQFTGGAWANRVMNGANGTSPHADSRCMVYDQAGNILQSNDGGIFKLSNPGSSTRSWSSLNANITPTEAHAGAYDELNHVIVTGNQDTGTSYQLTQNGTTWNSFTTGDGGNPQVDNNVAAHPGTVIRYGSFSGLGSFNRSTWNSANTFLGFSLIATNIINGPFAGTELANAPVMMGNPNVTFNNLNPATIVRMTGSWISDGFQTGQFISVSGTTSNNGTYQLALVTANTLTLVAGEHLVQEGPKVNVTIMGFLEGNVQFYNPYVLNRINPTRMLIGTADIYESMNQGDTLSDVSGFTGSFIGDGLGNSPLSYGGFNSNGTQNPGAFFAAAGATIYHRTADGNPVITIASPTGGTIRALVMDPRNVTHVFVLGANNQVFGSFDDGVTWTNMTANLGSLSSSVRSIEIFSPSASPINTVLLVGGLGGVWQMRRPGGGGSSWTSVGTGLPQTLVYDLTYDYADNVLVADTLGRGAWTLTSFFRGGGGTGTLSDFAAAPVDGGSDATPPDAIAPPVASFLASTVFDPSNGFAPRTFSLVLHSAGTGFTVLPSTAAPAAPAAPSGTQSATSPGDSATANDLVTSQRATDVVFGLLNRLGLADEALDLYPDPPGTAPTI
jgi:hypothetical protein